MNEKVAIIGAGYVGMQIGMAFVRLGLPVVAYDTNKQRINELKEGKDSYLELSHFNQSNLLLTDDPDSLSTANYFIVTISTPIDSNQSPDLTNLEKAVHTLSQYIKKNHVVIIESTIYPGTTEEKLIPILERQSGLKSGLDFFVGYSPERIVPGSKEHPLEQEIKVISGQNVKALRKIKRLYQLIFKKLYEAPAIKVAEASKLLENIQRDVNIALMNEYAQVMVAMGISMHEVLKTAETKWNFLPFKPGLVGGHCIPVDPYYLIYKAHLLDVRTDLIETTRKINEHFIYYLYDVLKQLLKQQGLRIENTCVAILGMSFKPNVSDIRHSLSAKLYQLIEKEGGTLVAVDPLAKRDRLKLNWVDLKDLSRVKVMILAQNHHFFIKQGLNKLCQYLDKEAVFMDITGTFVNHKSGRTDVVYWSL